MKATKMSTLGGVVALTVIAIGPNLYAGVSFEGGISLVENSTLHDDAGTKVSFDPGMRLDLRVGGAFTNGFGLDLDVGLIYNQMKVNPLSTETGTLDFYQIPMMLEVTYSLPRFGGFRAYVGAGIGAVCGIFTGSGTGLLGFDSDITFGYQATVGLKYALSEDWEMGIAYRFLGTTEHELDSGFGSAVKMDGTFTHSLMATISFKF
jgi:opacity protein-like surface antigen